MLYTSHWVLNCGLPEMEHAALIVVSPLGLPFLIYGIID